MKHDGISGPYFILILTVFIALFWSVAVWYSVAESSRQEQFSKEGGKSRIHQYAAEYGQSRPPSGANAHFDSKGDAGHYATLNKKMDPNWFIAFFTLGLLIVAFLQWTTYKQQAKLMREALLETARSANAAEKSATAAKESADFTKLSAKNTHRPYVSFSPNLDKDPIPNEDYSLVFNCTNHGDSPALDIGFVGDIWRIPTRAGNVDIPGLPEKMERGKINLFPKQAMHESGLGFQPNTRKRFTADEIDDFVAGTHVFIVGLRIEYSDLFKETHATQAFWIIHYSGGVRRLTLAPGKSVIT